MKAQLSRQNQYLEHYHENFEDEVIWDSTRPPLNLEVNTTHQEDKENTPATPPRQENKNNVASTPSFSPYLDMLAKEREKKEKEAGKDRPLFSRKKSLNEMFERTSECSSQHTELPNAQGTNPNYVTPPIKPREDDENSEATELDVATPVNSASQKRIHLSQDVSPKKSLDDNEIVIPCEPSILFLGCDLEWRESMCTAPENARALSERLNANPKNAVTRKGVKRNILERDMDDSLTQAGSSSSKTARDTQADTNNFPLTQKHLHNINQDIANIARDFAEEPSSPQGHLANRENLFYEIKEKVLNVPIDSLPSPDKNRIQTALLLMQRALCGNASSRSERQTFVERVTGNYAMHP